MRYLNTLAICVTLMTIPHQNAATATETKPGRTPAEVFETVRAHDFHPVDSDSFTIDRELEVHGIADLDDNDWKVRLLAVRDLVRAGTDAAGEIAGGLEDDDVQVRYVATLEAHDTYRARVMVGKELDPEYWFAEESFQEAYTGNIWWPHLIDRAAAVGARYGIDPMAYAVHAEYINRPATFIIDPEGTVRLAYFGTYWGDRPEMHEVLEMIRTGEFDFEHPERR